LDGLVGLGLVLLVLLGRFGRLVLALVWFGLDGFRGLVWFVWLWSLVFAC
jgi:hypothetical protein